MTYLTRWDPVREMFNMRTMMDRILENFFETPSVTTQLTTWSLPVDVIENEAEYVVTASIPGIKPDELEVAFTNHTLTIKGEVKRDPDIEEARYHLQERRYGRFERSLYLPVEIDADHIEASYEAGVLNLRLPKSEAARPKRIAISTTGSQKMLEGHFEESRNA